MLTGTEQTPAGTQPAAPMSLRAYARRRGTSAPSVLRAIKQQRLKDSLVFIGGKAQIADPVLADQEWDRNTDHSRAPAYVKQRAAGVTPQGVTQTVTARPAVTRLPPAAAEGGMTLADASTREKLASAQLKEIEVQERRGQLIPVQDHERRLDEAESRWSELLALTRAKLLAVPSQVKSDCQELTLQHVAAIEARIRQALEAIADGEGLRP